MRKNEYFSLNGKLLRAFYDQNDKKRIQPVYLYHKQA